MMKVLVACEYSAIVRDAFRERGHDAWSCDLLPTEGDPRWHIQGDVLEVLNEAWDLMIAHPPCTRLSNSGVKHLYRGMSKQNGIDPDAWQKMEDAASFYCKFLNPDLKIKRRAVENPVMHRYAIELTGGRATQYVHPSMFGTKRRKLTGLRLIYLPKLIPTNDLEGDYKKIAKGTREYREWNYCWYMSPGPDRGHKRAKTEKSIAKAMAEQWG